MNGIPRRSDSALAGTFCADIPCKDYARYGVTWDQGDGKLAEPEGVCGRHMNQAVRDVWLKHNAAAIIQEVPGSWRQSNDTKVRRP